MNWLQRISTFAPNLTFAPPASGARLQDAERTLGTTLPGALREVLLQTDGVAGEFGLALVWPIERIVQDNLAFRRHPDFPNLYMPFEPALFFADAGNGDQFFFPVLAEGIPRDEVFAWNHENDSRTWVAPSLERYLEWWLDGRIKL